MIDNWILSLDDIGQEHNDFVGKKCANLGEMRKMGLRTPLGFVLTVEAYREFLTKSGAIQELHQYVGDLSFALGDVGQYEKTSNVMRGIVESKQMPQHMQDNIASYYDNLCQECGIIDLAVATRSAGATSHPGQYETYLNVKGKSDLMEKIIRVWSSTFNTVSLLSFGQLNLALRNSIGVAVLKMVNARSAGISFTADPNTGDRSKIIIEANWGLGESVVGGLVTPDTWILDKESFTVIDKRLGQKNSQVVFSDIGVVEEELSFNKRSNFCLSDEEAVEIGRLSKILEEHFGVPQDVEWAIDSDLIFPTNILLLQTRPEVIATNKTRYVPSHARSSDIILEDPFQTHPEITGSGEKSAADRIIDDIFKEDSK